MSRYGRYGGKTKVYVGNLGTGAGKGELERAFGYYGPLRTVWIARNPPGFAFVEFEDPRDAEDAVRGLDGKVICGSRVRVELSTGMPRRSRYDRPPTRRPFDPNDRCYECGEKGHYAYDCHRYSRRRRSRSKNTTRCRDRLIDTSRSPRSARPWSKEGRPANLQGPGPGPGPGLDLTPGPVGGGTPAHAAGVGAGDHALLLQGDLDLEHPKDLGMSSWALKKKKIVCMFVCS
ncbi:serine/arginine-rich splicing factor 7-like [Arapaima gigas]